MQYLAQTETPRPATDGARDLQAKLYREIGISAVAAALHSISQPEPGTRSGNAATSAQAKERITRAA